MSHKSTRFFTFENPPKSGKVKKLWDWFIREFGVEEGDSFNVSVNHPGFWQRGQGTPGYCIVWNGGDYVCDAKEVDKIVQGKRKDYDDDWRFVSTRIYYL